MDTPIDYGKKMYVSKVVLMLFCIFSVTIVTSKVFAIGNIANEDGLIGYWNFDELEEGDTEFLDLSGNGRHGILVNNTHPVEGKFGKALKFDGLADYAEILFEAGLSCPDAMSFEAWIYPTPPHQADINGGIVNNLHGKTNSRLLITKEGMVMSEIYVDVEGDSHIRVRGPKALSEVWSHVVYVYDGTQGIVYVNGEPGEPISYPGKARTGSSSFTIGWGHHLDNYHYNGLIDEIKIYNKVLSPQEIAFKAANPPTSLDYKGSVTSTKEDSMILLHEDFEDLKGRLPSGWTIYGGILEVTDKRSSTGNFSLRVDDPSPNKGAGIRSRHIPVEEGCIYLASVDSLNESGVSRLYFEFWDDKGVRIAHTIGSNDTELTWKTMSANGVAPVGAKTATLLLYGHAQNVGVSYYDNVLLTKAAEAPESIFADQEITFTPSFSGEHEVILKEHPRLFYTAEDITNIKKVGYGVVRYNYLREESFSVNHYGIKPIKYPLPPVEPEDEGPPPGFAPGGYTYWTSMSREFQDRLEGLALSYIITGEKEFAETAISYALALADWEKWTEFGLPSLPLAHITSGVLAVYDMLYYEMTEEQRVKIREAVIEKCINRTSTIAHSKSDVNIQLIGNMAMGLAALSFLDEEEGMANHVQTIKDWALWYLDRRLNSGNTEGLMYTSYSLEYLLVFADALARITGDTDLLEHPYIQEEYMQLFLYFLAPGAKTWANFCNAGLGPDIDINSNIIMNILANRCGNGYAGWYLNKEKKGAPTTFTEAIYGSDDFPVASLDKWPTSKAFNIGWAALRSGWGDGDVLLAFQSSSSDLAHNHWDRNSFILNVNSEWLLSDPGYHSYNPGPESDVSTGTMGHNCILFDGEGQSLKSGGAIVGFLASPTFDYVAGDATSTYVSLGIGKWQRDILYLKPDYFLIFDEVDTGVTERDVEIILRPATESLVYLDGKRAGAAPSIFGTLFGIGQITTAEEIGIHRPLASAVFKTLWPTGMSVNYGPYKGAERYGSYIRIGPKEKLKSETFVSMITTEANKRAKVNTKGATPPKVDVETASDKISMVVYGENSRDLILHKRQGHAVETNKVSSDGRYSIVSIGKANTLVRFALVEGMDIVWDGVLLAKADHPMTLAFGYEGRVWSGTIYSQNDGVISFYVPEFSSVYRNGEALSSDLYSYEDRLFTIKVEQGTTTFELHK